MPDYKKKRVRRFGFSPYTAKKKQIKKEKESDNNIKMTSGGKKPEKTVSEIRVIKGVKLERKRRMKKFLSAFAVIFAIIFTVEIVLPGGIYENLQNLFYLAGTGGYPVQLESSETLNSSSKGSYYYVLTNNELNAFSNGGKRVLSVAHGFENPVLKTGATRALVFSQGGNGAVVYNLSGVKASVSTDDEIITGGISDSGKFVIVTRGTAYASTVTVYNKNGEKEYVWNSATDIVNNAILSKNGKKIAVSVFNANSGNFSSKIHIINFKSADAEYTESVENGLVYDLKPSGRGFFAATENTVSFVEWSGKNKKDYSNKYGLSLLRFSNGGAVAVFSRESNRSDNKIVLFTSSGKKKAEIDFGKPVNDVQTFGGHIYCISNTKVYAISKTGEIIKSAECGFGAVRLSVINENSAAVMTDNRIEKIKLK